MSTGSIRSIVRQAIKSWRDDDAASMGAALAYYALFSMAPLLLIVVSIAGLVFGRDAAEGKVVAELGSLMGFDSAAALQAMLKSVARPAQGVLGTVVGVGLVLVGAMGVFGQLQDSLDRVWRAPERPPDASLLALVRARAAAFAMILVLGFLLVASVLVSTAVGAMVSLPGQPAATGLWVAGINIVVSYGFVTLIFALVYKIIPRARIEWHDVWVGAAITALLFTAGKFLIGLYIGSSGLASGFGAAGSVIVILAWMYYAAQLFLLGAEFTWVYAHARGSRQRGAVVVPVAVPPRAAVAQTRARLRSALGLERDA
jgi:membrane protein